MKVSPVDVRSNKRVAGHTCFKDLAERLCLSLFLTYDQLPPSVSGARVYRKETIVNCQIKPADKRIVCLVCEH